MTSTAEMFSIRGKRVVDPFHRLGSTVSSTLAIVEFCQVEGPRPLAHVSVVGGGTCIDIDALCVWLMSSETACGTVLMLYNQQMALYALSYHFVIYDVKARAFQRPLCIAFLSSTKPTGEVLNKFTKSIRKLLVPLILCNRRQFLHQIDTIIQLHANIEANTVHDYYNLNPDELKTFQKNHKFINTVDQAKRLRCRMMSLYDRICRTSNGSQCDNHKTSEKEIVENTFLPFLTNSPLCHIKELAPCVYENVIIALKPLLSHLNESSVRKGVLYSSGIPVLRFPKYESPIKGRKSNYSNHERKGEENLKDLSPHLDDVLFPVLSGGDMLVCGSSQRKDTVLDIVNKLSVVKPRSHANFDISSWLDSVPTRPHGVVGVQMNKNEQDLKASPGFSILDVNTSTLNTVPYQGKLLADFHVRRRFPSDHAFELFVSALFSKISMYLYIAKHSLPAVIRSGELSLDDELILVNLLSEIDLVRYQNLNDAVTSRRNKRVSIVKSIQL